MVERKQTRPVNTINQGSEMDSVVLPNKNNNIDDRSNNKKTKKGLIVIGVVLILAIGGIVEYNYHKNKAINQAKQEQVSKLNNFIITHEIIAQDFVNSEKKMQSDVTPPSNYQERFMKSINKSLEAIKTNTPSQPDFKDLKEDTFNIASSYSILGNYKQAEDWYYKVLEKWPNDYKSLMNLGDLYILMGQYQDAANKYLDTIIAYPNDARIYSKLADLYVKYSAVDDKLDKADKVYAFGIKQANNPKELYKNYSFFLENYMKDYERALEMEREYQKITGSKAEQEIERLEKMIK